MLFEPTVMIKRLWWFCGSFLCFIAFLYNIIDAAVHQLEHIVNSECWWEAPSTIKPPTSAGRHNTHFIIKNIHVLSSALKKMSENCFQFR